MISREAIKICKKAIILITSLLLIFYLLIIIMHYYYMLTKMSGYYRVNYYLYKKQETVQTEIEWFQREHNLYGYVRVISFAVNKRVEVTRG